MSFSTLHSISQRVVSYLWDPEPKNTDPMTTIWLLGVEYPPPSTNTSTNDAVAEAATIWPPGFLADFESRIWLTYRSEFPAIPRSATAGGGGQIGQLSLMTTMRSHLPANAAGFTSDQGWGCMIRSGQCVLANALQILQYGREWRKSTPATLDEKALLSLFADTPSAPYSIHNFVSQGESRDIRSGQWFGPTPTAQCIKALVDAHPTSSLRVHLTYEGGNVYNETFLSTAVGANGVFQSTLLLVATRLGVDSINPVYWSALKSTLQMPQSIGIAGGRPSSSHYFVGCQGDWLFYLDPHVVRPALEANTEEGVESCHTNRLRRLNIKDVDPSMMFAFLIRDEKEWEDWKERLVKGKGAVITVGEKEPRASAVDEVISESEGEGDM
ncbi:hypothetical protein FN846DRAFT_443007 [Sphaerosporella brunnea]|uniref:Cysteine protease n=1 Tax=Sphaerosporella brunnea TaxID=1250544 RepID=A0A5J5EGR9_9PEZI|nr:hypothetical protein FN846DRAFT_443007 [Sphaerosporella brunnea]